MEGRQSLICCNTSLSKHFVIKGVKVKGLNSLRLLLEEFLGTGIIVANLRQDGTTASDRERLKVQIYLFIYIAL